MTNNTIGHEWTGPHQTRCTVLQVEDNQANALLVEQFLGRRDDLTLVTAHSGSKGLEMARSMRPDVILMDINLPDINGLQAMTLLREDPMTAHIPVIALSSDAYPKQIENGVKAGFYVYLTKPYKLDDLTSAIDAALASSKKNCPLS